MEHRAGWDATFSAPKSVSLTALVGGDERLRQAHLEELGLEGAGPAQIAAHRTRDAKSPLSAERMLEQHNHLAAAFGYQPLRVAGESLARGRQQRHSVEERQRLVSEAIVTSNGRR